MYAANAPPRLAGRGGRVDAVVVEERARRVAELGRERGVGVEHEVLGVLPVDGLVVARHGGHAVVVGELVDPEQLGLEAIPAAGELVAVAHRAQQGLDRLVGRLVGEVARREPVGVAAQAVVGRLVVQERVEDERAGPQAGLERDGHGLGRAAADVAVGRHEVRQRAVERDRLGRRVEVDRDGGDVLAEQAPPGRRARDRLLVEDLLLGLGEQVRAVAPGGAQEVPGGVEAVGAHELLGLGVVEGCPLELEEQQLGLDRRALLLHALHERADRGIGGVDAEAQHRVVAGAAGELGELLQLADGGGERGRVEVGDAAGVGLGERLRARRGLVEQPVGARVVLAVDEW